MVNLFQILLEIIIIYTLPTYKCHKLSKKNIH